MQRINERTNGTVAFAAHFHEAVPRYTSYPTAPHFHQGVDAGVVRKWLEAIPQGEDISLYIHIPFCDRLCWFCACHTKMTQRYEPVAEFLTALRHEIATIGKLVRGARVRALHFGGGSPTIMKPDDVIRLNEALREAFDFRDDAEISVELDPNDLDEQRLHSFAAIGMTRASLGVQDFDPKVQRAINREQGFELTKAVADGVRSRGVRSLNLDLLYGLPHQSLESLEATIKQALQLAPDRIALFGYAHVPWFKKHQTMIDESALPGPEERFAQQELAGQLIVNAGYERVGLDHFARPGDSLAMAARRGTLRRNFQGYTDDRCQTLIGLGPSSISRFRQGFSQNNPATASYARLVSSGKLATGRGFALSEDDHARSWVIEQLMCNFSFSAAEAKRRFGSLGDHLVEEALEVASEKDGGMLVLVDDVFLVPQEARVLVRTIASRFDSYLKQGKARHSVAV